jgi:low affinity Fe/Cu permease
LSGELIVRLNRTSTPFVGIKELTPEIENEKRMKYGTLDQQGNATPTHDPAKRISGKEPRSSFIELCIVI